MYGVELLVKGGIITFRQIFFSFPKQNCRARLGGLFATEHIAVVLRDNSISILQAFFCRMEFCYDRS